jgi:hypothetical protein
VIELSWRERVAARELHEDPEGRARVGKRAPVFRGR